YSTIPTQRRRELHTRVISAVEKLYPDNLSDYADRLAQHAQRGHIWPAAIRYTRMIGHRALAQSANVQATRSFEEALSMLSKLPDSLDRMRLSIDLTCD